MSGACSLLWRRTAISYTDIPEEERRMSENFIAASQEAQPRKERRGFKSKQSLGQESIHLHGVPILMQSMTAGKSPRSLGRQRTPIGRSKPLLGRRVMRTARRSNYVGEQ